MSVGGKESYVERIAGMFRSAKISAAITAPEFIDHLTAAAGPCGSIRVLTHAELNELPASGQQLEPFRPDEAAYIQYSSGSTSAPKGVLIPQRAICANSFGILEHGPVQKAIGRSPGCRSITIWAWSASASRRWWRRAASTISLPSAFAAVPACG